MLSPLLTLLLQPSPVAITIDPAIQKPISKYIYGVNFPHWPSLGKGITLARQGGNRMSAYNWETNASNAGNDFHHQNDGYMGTSNEPGWTVRTFVEPAQRNGAAVIVTVPTLGYVSADKNADGDVNKTPDYLNVRFHKSHPAKPGGAYAFPPDTSDKGVYQDEFVAWLTRAVKATPPVWFSLDNEPDLWHSTHERITPKKPGYADIIANNIAFATAIKKVAPKSLIFGPANYGWQGFRTFQNAEDAHGRDFLDVYLAAMKAAEKKAGKRLIDVLDIHWYPEAQGDGKRIAFNNGGETAGTFAARIQASRSLWDPTYVEESWITRTLGQKPIVLLPRVLAQIAKHYPDTKLGITEYDYGGGDHVSGLIAQADVLGIFGRYGVFAACQWGMEPRDRAQIGGMRAFVNYDGKGGRFFNAGLKVTGEKAAENAVFASVNPNNRNQLVLVAINKMAKPMTFSLKVRGHTVAAAQAFVRSEGSFVDATPKATPVVKGAADYTAPPLSVATIRVSLAARSVKK